ncbi:MAG: ribosome silencing factor [SAR86 cluster bacterium]
MAYMAQKILPSKLRDLVSSSLDELKAVDPVTINVKKLSSFTDYMIIASGTSNRHIQSIGEKVLEDLKVKNIKPLGLEGEGSEEWVLIDVGDVVLHLMSASARAFYDLESLWDPELIR